MSADVTVLLKAVSSGDAEAASALMTRVYSELKGIAAGKMAHEAPGHTLQPTALVHEAWLRLVDDEGRSRFENRAHFFGAASEAMRRVLVDRARRRQSAKRGGGAARVESGCAEIAQPAPPEEVLAVNDALDKLAAFDPRKAELVKLRYFVGLSFEETAALLEVSVPTAHRDWAYARAWLKVEIGKNS